MESKPLYYDGSIQNSENTENEADTNVTYELTDDIRKNISGNPYVNN